MGKYPGLLVILLSLLGCVKAPCHDTLTLHFNTTTLPALRSIEINFLQQGRVVGADIIHPWDFAPGGSFTREYPFYDTSPDSIFQRVYAIDGSKIIILTKVP